MSGYLTKNQFGTPKTLAERYAHRWLSDHCGEAGEPIMQSLAEMMIQWRANDSNLTVSEENCPGHVASAHDAKVCGRCGAHIDSLR